MKILLHAPKKPIVLARKKAEACCSYGLKRVCICVFVKARRCSPYKVCEGWLWSLRNLERKEEEDEEVERVWSLRDERV